MFSSRLPSRLDPNALSLAIARARASGAALIDLTETNPTSAGIPYPDSTMSSLSDPAAARYRPDPRGWRPARDAVRASLPAEASAVPVDQIVLTASTSEAYGFLFKLLCDPGARVLVPQPSYPLFDLLTSLEGVVASPYRLDHHGVWSINRGSVESALTPAIRAVLVVSPNNPTGSMLRRDDREWLVDLAASRGLAIIADEVFGDYPLSPRPDARSLAGETRALTFTLGGLSKSAGLPQHKLAWILVSGPAAIVADALTRLDIICDTYLSVATPAQVAAPALIAAGRHVRFAIARRLAGNLDELRRQVSAVPAITLLEPEGGWSVVLRVPSIRSEDAIVLDALSRGVLVHPGYFFDFEAEAYVVVSLLPDSAAFAAGVARLLPALAVDAPS